MSLKVRDPGGVLRTIGAASIRDSSATLRTIDQIRMRADDGTLKQVYQQGIRLAVSPDEAFGFSSGGSGPIYTNSVTVSVAGGTPPYAHVWTTESGFGASSPVSPTTSFVGAPVSGDTTSGFATDTVTDANGITNSISVYVTIERGGFS
jgi:hypothetical protein